MPDEKTPAASPDPKLPVDNITDALPLLRRPFAPGAMRWKVQSEWPKEGEADGAIIVGYIDARLVAARLNTVVGGNWSEKPSRVADNPNALLGELKVFEQTHVDLGVGQGKTADMKSKAAHSDALKRPAVRFGIGEPVYAMPEIRLGVTADGSNDSDGNPTIKRVTRGNRQGRAGYLTEAVEAHIRSLYEKWLNDHGTAAFGPVLDHGDASTGSVGYEAPEAADTDDTAGTVAGEALTDAASEEARKKCRELRDAVRVIDPDALPESSFDNALAQRDHSQDRLDDFVGNLTELLASVERVAALEVEVREKLTEAQAKKAIEQAGRRGSRSERATVLQDALDKAAGSNG